MDKKINIKPKMIKSNNIPNVINEITNGLSVVVGKLSKVCFLGYTDDRCEFIRVFNIEKKNAVKQRDKNGKYVTLSPAVVTAYVYDFPIDLLENSGLSVIQRNRHFIKYENEANC